MRYPVFLKALFQTTIDFSSRFGKYKVHCLRLFASVAPGGLRAPRSPLRQGRRRAHLLRTALPSSPGSMTVGGAILRQSLLLSSATIFTLSFLSDATPFARLRAAVFRKHRFSRQTVYTITDGRFCGTFSAAPARFFTSAQVFAPSRPAKGCSPFDPRQGAPCTCPASPFMAKPGFCVQRGFAEGAYAVTSSNLRVVKINSCSEQSLLF